MMSEAAGGLVGLAVAFIAVKIMGATIKTGLWLALAGVGIVLFAGCLSC